MLRSDKITKEHVPGKYCEERHHCGKCTSIRHYLKVLRHVSGACLKNKNPNKCPVCYEARQTPYGTSVNKIYMNMVPKIVLKLYKLMLKGKYS